jgi:tripartite-type tricarboxylate transporter receptor subunit TctC
MGGWFRMLAVAVGVAAAAGAASAQTPFPTKAVHLFVPYPAGGAVDILARTLGDELSKNWGQPVVVENRPGAGGGGGFVRLPVLPKTGPAPAAWSLRKRSRPRRRMATR